jgi:hypothetical protein
MARLIKYMGKADLRTIKKGANFGGQLRDGIEADLSFSKENNWVLDVEELGLSDEALSLLLAEQEKGVAAFKDVTDLKLIPLNANQKTFSPRAKAVPNAEATVAAVDDDEPDDDTAGASVSGDGAPAGGTAAASARRRASAGGATT